MRRGNVVNDNEVPDSMLVDLGRLNVIAAIMAEWGRADRGFVERQASFRGEDAEGLNGGFVLTPSTVRDDKSTDEFFGEEREDWLF